MSEGHEVYKEFLLKLAPFLIECYDTVVKCEELLKGKINKSVEVELKLMALKFDMGTPVEIIKKMFPELDTSKNELT